MLDKTDGDAKTGVSYCLVVSTFPEVVGQDFSELLDF